MPESTFEEAKARILDSLRTQPRKPAKRAPRAGAASRKGHPAGSPKRVAGGR